MNVEWRKISDWRNWRLPVKLGVVLLVPVAVAVGAGALQISGYVDRSNNYVQMQGLVRLRSDLAPLISSVQQERTLAAQSTTSGSGVGAYQNQISATDNAAATVRRRVDRTEGLSDVARNRFNELGGQLETLKNLREKVAQGGDGGDPSGGTTGYTAVVKSLLDFEQALISQFGDEAIAGTALALHNMVIAQEQVSLQHAVVLAGIGRTKLLGPEVRVLEQSDIRLQDRLSDFQAVGTTEQRRAYDQTVTGAVVANRTALVERALTQPDGVPAPATRAGQPKPPPSFGIAVEDWNKASGTTIRLMEQVVRQLQDELANSAAALQDDTSNKAGAAAVILLAMLLIAGTLGFVIGRYLLRSLSELRHSALDVAHHHLPEVVAAIRADRKPDTEIEPVPVHTVEEFGQLARAFDAVHEMAIRSAVEQSSLRSGMKNIFVNLSRRSQGLVERQLKLMEELERHEENPEQLANLFKLDHLATRMRRNNENLMVLSGTDVARRFHQPVPLADVLRAAASEIEHYQRVVVKSTPSVEIVGYAASDLVRLVAELLDNATAFSAPSTQVMIGSRIDQQGSVLVEVAGQGIGMGPAELTEANERLSSGTEDDVPVSRQMGLFVVGRLAGRHGITVRLRAPGEGREGLRAFVLVPSELVRAQEEAPAPAQPRHAALPQPKPALAKQPHVVVKTPNLAPPPAPAPAIEHPRESAEWTSFRGAAIDEAPQQRNPRPEPVAAPKPVPVETPNETTSSWFSGGAVQDEPVNGDQSSPPASSPSVVASWFGKKPGGTVWEQAGDPATDAGETDAGLPKRAPRKNLLPDLAARPENGTRPAAGPKRDPERARGFLASYQTGLRQAPLGGNGNGNGQGNGQHNGEKT
ncbi:nitrate- and nitrite sensing domain-containing protein [Lentzea aerocolonigenes]|uniref:nitrate- and nitrite sensing domain-containing protein n=1 Tax=Lentzea aerocolonigenes TaxID=68170 RepID=UPI000750B393|nr:nitrate- and nitrite sensing domain-containing protein [Lentzea aerocolonigenes]MCP2247428.1 Signal transduction histidine kinase [Lentzea aerocolonigenes]